MVEHRRARLTALGVLAAIVVLIGAAFALGGKPGSSHESAGSAGGSLAGSAAVTGTAPGSPEYGTALDDGHAAAPAPSAAPSPGPTSAVQNAASKGGAQIESAVDGVTATRVVKTGNIDLRVTRGQVQSTVSKLVALTTSLGGYVSQSRTDSVAGSPNGEVTLRIPAGRFDHAVTAAEHLGHVTSLTTNAEDVTGRYVDLGARLSALKRTRETYLSILGGAKTIGSTLEVQQRVDDVQQQIEELQGQLKVLRNQSADGTLTIDVTQAGDKVVVHPVTKHNGIGAAWHRSVNRFSRGFDEIVGALGPLLLAILVLAVLAGVARLGYRGARRATGEAHTG